MQIIDKMFHTPKQPILCSNTVGHVISVMSLRHALLFVFSHAQLSVPNQPDNQITRQSTIRAIIIAIVVSIVNIAICYLCHHMPCHPQQRHDHR